MYGKTYKIICESLNFVGYINLIPREEYFNSQGIAEIDDSLNRITGLRIKSITENIHRGLSNTIYKRPETLLLSNDSEWSTAIKLKLNGKLIFYACINDNNIPRKVLKDNIKSFFEKYFKIDKYMTHFYEFESTYANPGQDYSFKPLLKHHNNYSCCGNEKFSTTLSNTPIEVIFKNELINHNIKFEEQVDFTVDGRKFTKPDFILRDYRILIYCDGATYHNNPERIAMDKQQDRWLQIYGYYPFRYTGKEIMADVKYCVRQLIALMRRIKNQ